MQSLQPSTWCCWRLIALGPSTGMPSTLHCMWGKCQGRGSLIAACSSSAEQNRPDGARSAAKP